MRDGWASALVVGGGRAAQVCDDDTAGRRLSRALQESRQLDHAVSKGTRAKGTESVPWSLTREQQEKGLRRYAQWILRRQKASGT